MKRIKLVGRLLHINQILIKHGLDELILSTDLFSPLRYSKVLSPNYWVKREHGPRAVRIRRTLEDLGPIFVKLGQVLSTRRDLLPEDIADELALLQDRVPPFDPAEAQTIIEEALGGSVTELFASFDGQPLASASVAQVHAATLLSGEDVVVKVLRPDIEPRIRHDVALMYELARLAQRLSDDVRRMRPVDVVAEFEKTILHELDLVREGANASELRRNFENSGMLYVPKIYWDLTRINVLVMERIYGIPVGDVQQLKAQGVDLKLLAHRGVEIFFTQVLRDNFFHADMHPGNVFVNPADSSYIAVDFGIVGSLTPADQHYLAHNLIAFFNRDYHRVAELHVQSEWVPDDTRVDELEAAVRAVCEPIFEKPISEISYGHLLLRLFQTARNFNAEVQPQLVLFQKTLLNIEGLGRELYPQLDLWETAKPFLENWFKEKIGPKATVKKIAKQFPDWIEQMPEIPSLAYQLLHDSVNGQLSVQWRSKELAQLHDQIKTNHRSTTSAIIGGSCLISAAILLGLSGFTLMPGWLLGGVGALFLLRGL